MAATDSDHAIGVAKAPLWFYFVAFISLLWNIMGLLAFVIQMTMTPEAMAQMSPDQIKLYESTPAWLDCVFGFAVVSGVIGCLLLLIKKPFLIKCCSRLLSPYWCKWAMYLVFSRRLRYWVAMPL